MNPLRERRADILPLAEHFLGIYGQQLKTGSPHLLPETRAALLDYAWPGNIRELENVIQSAVLASVDGAIHPRNLQTAASIAA